MEAKANYALVGLTVVLLALGLVGAILWLSKRGNVDKPVFYTVYFKEQGLGGLQVDGNVTMKGIKVGTVSELNISATDVERVHVVLRLNGDIPVKTDTQAVVRRNLLTGLAYIELTGTSQRGELLTNILPGESFPIIKEGKSELTAVADNLPTLLEQTNKLMSDAQLFLSEDNARSVSRTIENIARVSDAFGENPEQTKVIFNNIAKAAENLSVISTSLREATGKIDFKDLGKKVDEAVNGLSATFASLDDQVQAISDAIIKLSDGLGGDIKNAADSVSRAGQGAAMATERLDSPREILTGPTTDSLGPGEQ